MFQKIEFMEPLRKFLANPPWLEDGEKIEIDYMSIDNARTGETAALAVTGLPRAIIRTDVTGNGVIQYSVNLILALRRMTNGNDIRRELADWIINYIMWVNYEQSVRKDNKNPLLPKFGNTNKEEITASGGRGAGATQTKGEELFELQIHLFFEIEIESEELKWLKSMNC